MTLNNVNIYKDGHNYYLQDVVAEEYIDGAWHHDTEFSQAKCQLLSKLGVVLILDRSQSLGTDFALVKTYAKSFVDVVVTNSPYTPIGIVDFSTDVQTRAPATDYTSIKSYIDGLTQAQYTSYYAAIRAGMNMFTTVPRISGYLPYVFTLKPTLTWAPSTGEYEVQASTSSDVSAPFVWESGITSSAYTFATSLTDGTPYYWRNKPSGGSWTPPGTFVPSEAEGLAIVSFTDGADNMADPGTYDALLADLKAGTVKSFTIGLTGKGDLDTTKLQALAVGGSYALASSAAALQGIFDEFSLAVSNAYRVTYTRTNQLITSPRKVRFTLSASLDRSGGTVPQTGVVISSNSEGFEQSTSLPAGWTGSWGVDTSTASGGTHSLRSGAIGANSYSSVQLTRTMAAGGNVSFDYKVSSEGGFDNLCFYVDGVQHGSSWSGEVGWTSASFGVGAGTHIFKWTYSKDANTSTGSDAAWIDDVVIR